MSLGDVAKLIGNKTSGYTSWLARQLGIQPRAFEEARLKGIKEKRRKYERKPFDGTDEDKAYLLGLTQGDLSVSRPFIHAIRVSTSTTHPAMTELFRSEFEKYGHVYEHPRYKKETSSYEWNLSAVLDDSFDFLLKEFQESREWIEQTEARVFGYLSGFLDADGSILPTNDKYGQVYIFVDYFNNDKAILDWIQSRIKVLGYFSSLRINKREGYVTKKYGIIHRSDYLQLSIYGMDQIYELLARLKPRHPEKVFRHSIASSTHKDQEFATIEKEVLALRAQIDEQRDVYVLRAKAEYEKKHPA